MGTIRTIDLREYFASGQFDKDCEEYQAERAKNTRNGKVLVGVDKNGREVYEGDTVLFCDWPCTAYFETQWRKRIAAGTAVLEE